MNETEARLLKGARVLGDFWRAGARCQEAWRLFPLDADPVYAGGGCACEPKTKFCKAKRQWLALAAEAGRELVEGPYGVVLVMTAREFDASGLTLKVEFPQVGLVGIGPNGMLPMTALAKVARAPETLPSIVGIIKAFPGSHIAEEAFAGLPTAPEEQFPQEEEAAA